MDLLGSDGGGVIFNQTGSYKSGRFTSRDGFTLRKKKTHSSQITTVCWWPGMTGFLVSVWSGVRKWVCGPGVEGPERWPLPWLLSLRGLREHVLVDSAPDQESHPTLWVLLCDFGRITRPLPHCRVRSCYRLCVGPGVSVEWKETAEEKALHKLWTEAGGCDEWMGGVQRGGVSSGTTNSPTLLPSQSLQPAFKQGTGKWMESTEKPPTS